ncbi:MAG TPA: ceramidase domain-containing protein [Longimicrobium sp.]|jgi:hypothetical protein
MLPRRIVHALLFGAPPLAFLALYLLLDSSSLSWADWRPATCMPGRCFCELIRPGSIRQPANALSSAGFVLVGAWILAGGATRGAGHGVNPITRNPAYRAVYGTAVLLIGFGSAFYHASLTFAGQFFDVFGMYLLATFIFLYNLARIRRLKTVTVVLGYVALNALLASLLYAVPALRRYLFAAVLLSALVPESLVRRRRTRELQGRHLLLALLLMAVGFGIWVLDITHRACSPSSWLQGHALWHVAGAAASLLVFGYYASEVDARAAPG